VVLQIYSWYINLYDRWRKKLTSSTGQLDFGVASLPLPLILLAPKVVHFCRLHVHNGKNGKNDPLKTAENDHSKTVESDPLKTD